MLLKPWPRWYKTFTCDCVSVIPHDADSDTIRKHLRGKVPGIKKPNGKWIGTIGSFVDRIMTEAEAKQAHHDGAAIGLIARRYLGLDIDVSLAALADGIEAWAVECFGPAPVRMREGSARRLMMYMTDTHMRKVSFVFHLPGTDEDTTEKPQCVELLGAAQYYNVAGIHPSGKPYYWRPENGDPCDLAPYDIVVITEDQIRRFFEGLAERFGLVPIRRTGNVIKFTGGHRTVLEDPSKWAPTPQAVVDLLKAYQPESLGHDEFVQHMAAIKAALGSDAEDFYADVLDWAPGVRSTEDVATRKVWDSITDTSVGWGWLVDKSGDPGGTVAQADFATPPDETNMPEDPKEKALRPIFGRWVYNTVDGVFYDRTDGGVLPKDGFNIEHTHIARYGSRKTPAVIVLNDPRLEKVRAATYLPGKQQIETVDDRKVFNLWRPSLLMPRFDNLPTPYIELLKRKISSETSREHLLNFMAFIIQHPGEKIGHAPLLWSDVHGVGKGTLLAPLVRAVGRHNAYMITPKDLQGNHNTYLLHQLIIVNEMYNFEKNVVYNTLKPLLEISETYLTVNPKNLAAFQIPNNQNWAFATNYPNSIPLDDTDRRLFVERCEEKETEKYFNEFYKWFNDGGAEITVGWLKQRPIEHFNPASPPPMTQAKQDMIKATRPPAVRWIMKQFEPGGAFHRREFITVAEIMEAATDHWSNLQTQVYENNVAAALRMLGFVAIADRPWIVDKPTTVWTSIKRDEVLNSTGALLVARLKADQHKN